MVRHLPAHRLGPSGTPRHETDGGRTVTNPAERHLRVSDLAWAKPDEQHDEVGPGEPVVAVEHRNRQVDDDGTLSTQGGQRRAHHGRPDARRASTGKDRWGAAGQPGQEVPRLGRSLEPGEVRPPQSRLVLEHQRRVDPCPLDITIDENSRDLPRQDGCER